MWRLVACSLGLLCIGTVAVACGDDEVGREPGAGGTGATGGTANGGQGATGGGGHGATSSGGSGATGGTSSGGTGGSSGDIPGGGTVLFAEPFDDANFDTRGWYDSTGGSISSSEHIDGSPSSFECHFAVGATSCSAGKPARHPITATESVYLGFHIKFSSNWVGSGLPYHPHMFHFVNDLDDQYVGPAHTYLTTYTEVVEGRAMLALQDSKNVDLNCILLNNDSFVGCNGDFDSYPFTEQRSVCSCNGLVGDLDGRDCFSNGNGTYYSSRAWRTPSVVFGDTPGPYDKTAWHFVEVYFEMNGIDQGVGVPDGRIRWVQDGQVLISYDHILLRTGDHPTLRFNQFAMLPYIGDGSPVDQYFWVDDMVVATARP
jgi:hypothetical protein